VSIRDLLNTHLKDNLEKKKNFNGQTWISLYPWGWDLSLGGGGLYYGRKGNVFLRNNVHWWIVLNKTMHIKQVIDLILTLKHLERQCKVLFYSGQQWKTSASMNWLLHLLLCHSSLRGRQQDGSESLCQRALLSAYLSPVWICC